MLFKEMVFEKLPGDLCRNLAKEEEIDLQVKRHRDGNIASTLKRPRIISDNISQ